MSELIELPDDLSFGQQLRIVRESKNLNVPALAKISKLHPSSIHDLENDRYRTTKIETVQMLSKALNFYGWKLFNKED